MTSGGFGRNNYFEGGGGRKINFLSEEALESVVLQNNLSQYFHADVLFFLNRMVFVFSFNHS